MMPPDDPITDPERLEPYCGNCGYTLTGATESSKCPECGRPLIEVLMRPALMGPTGRRWRSQARILGMPAIDVALGPHGRERIGRARGFIAIGDDARGVVALGGRAIGVVAIGGMALGGISLGGLAAGLVSAVGGCAIGGIAQGGMAAGGLAQGGGVFAFVGQGGGGAAWYLRAGGGVARYMLGPGRADPEAQEMFRRLAWFFGAGGGVPMGGLAVGVVLTFAVGAVLSLFALHRARRGADDPLLK